MDEVPKRTNDLVAKRKSRLKDKPKIVAKFEKGGEVEDDLSDIPELPLDDEAFDADKSEDDPAMRRRARLKSSLGQRNSR